MSLWESTSRATWDLFLTKYPEALAYACSRKVINYFICFLSFLTMMYSENCCWERKS